MRLGTTFSGDPATLAIRGRNVIVAGEPGSGKSYLAGLICEQLILQRYSLAILDPEGDYCALGDLPDVTVLGGDNPPPRVREIMQALRHPGESLVIDLSRLSADEKYDYVRAVVPVLALERRVNGLPHKILVDEAHHFLSVPLAGHLLDDALGGYIWITYQVSRLHESVGATDAVIFVTKERDDSERETLARLAGVPLAPEDIRDIPRSEAALLPSAEEACGRVLRFRMAERLTSHVRHRQKYFDMPVPGGKAFAFTDRGTVVGRAWTLRELVTEMAHVSPDALRGHFERHDLSRWIRDVFRDGALAADVHRIESRTVDEPDTAVSAALARVVTARYDIDAQDPSPEPALFAVT